MPKSIISAVAHEMEQKGYVRTEDKEKANVGIQLSYAQQRIQITTEDGMAAGGMPDSGDLTGEEDGIILIR